MKKDQVIPTPVKADTDWCKARLTELYPQAGSWKRLSKRRENDGTMTRIFASEDGTVVKINTDAAEVTITGLNSDIIEAELKSKAAQIKHCGDYGWLYYHQKRATVWWCASDGDGDDNTTTMEDVEKLLKVDGIAKVITEAEHSPARGNPDWKNLGRHGIEVALW